MFRNLDEVELYLFTSLGRPILKDFNVDKDIREKLTNIFTYRYDSPDIVRVWKIIDNKILAISEDTDYQDMTSLFSPDAYYIFEDIYRAQIGDIFIINYNRVPLSPKKVNKEVIDKAYLKGIMKKLVIGGWRNLEIDMEKLPNEINKKDIDKCVKKVVSEYEKEKRAERLERETAKIEREKREVNEEEKYNKDSVYKLFNLDINKNTYTYYSDRIILNKNISKVLSFSEATDTSRNTSLPVFEEKILDKQENYTKQDKDVNGNWNIKYSVTFGADNIKVNGTIVPKSRLRFILHRLMENPNIDIDLYKQLTAMKIDLLNLKELHFDSSVYGDGINIPIKFEIVDNDSFKVTLFEKTKGITWNKCKDLFYSGGTSRSVNRWMGASKLTEFSDYLGIRDEMLPYMRKLVMLHNIGDKNGA